MLSNVRAGLRRGHRYCVSCHIWRPPHAHHCQQCQRCVENFDHHCDVLHTCVGGLNHRWFTLFLLTTFFASLTLCGGGARTILLLGFYTGVVPTKPPRYFGHTVVLPRLRIASCCHVRLRLLTCQQQQQKSSHLHPASTHTCLGSHLQSENACYQSVLASRLPS